MRVMAVSGRVSWVFSTPHTGGVTPGRRRALKMGEMRRKTGKRRRSLRATADLRAQGVEVLSTAQVGEARVVEQGAVLGSAEVARLLHLGEHVHGAPGVLLRLRGF